MAEIIVDYSETGNRFKKYQNSWNVEPASGFPKAPRPAVGDVVTLTGYTVNPYTPTETASVQFHYVEEGGDRYLIEANTREGATPIYAAGVDDAIASGTVSFTITDVEEGDEVWIVSMVFGTPPIEEKALGGNAVTFFREKIEGMVGDLSDLTTTDKTNLVAAINEAAGGGGGGVTELTSADYNYPTDNPISVALWLLDPGIYYPATGVRVAYSSDKNNNGTEVVFVANNSSYSHNQHKTIIGISYAETNPTLISYMTQVSNGFSNTYYTAPLKAVQTTGTSSNEVMSQNAVTSMVYADPSQKTRISLGNTAQVNGTRAIAIGAYSNAAQSGAIALGAGAQTSAIGEMNIGSNITSYGYNSSNYRLLTGLYDPQSDHDAATKGYVDSIAPSITMTTTDPGEGAPLAANHFIGVYQ